MTALPPGHVRSRWLLLAVLLGACAVLVAWAVHAGVPGALLDGWRVVWSEVETGTSDLN
ncbi:hypothetical protein [Longispora urticae]